MTQTLSPAPRFDKLKRVLSELFQFDQADLDFGIYRIMNAKREEITRFLDDDLLPQVGAELGKLAGGNRAELEAKLKEETENTLRYGGDPEKSQPVQELRAKLAATADVSALEADIYNDLAGFFRRYYQNGDFLSLRRYKRDVYAIPYEGEEVKLHWANADQYYVKSSETFRDYTFHLPASNGEGARRVHFKLADADTATNDTKAETGKERRFVLADPPLTEENGELTVRFTYRASGEKQTKLNEAAAGTVFAQKGFDSWLTALKDPRPTEKNKTRTLLDKQLADYTAKNSFDYFIHKDLRGFLRRELDFFIKNEVLHLDDLETEGETRALAQLARVRAMRGVAHKVIEMLSQLENFQKKLWLKKKFVVSTDYCVTLDKVIQNAPELLDEVALSEAQRREWVRLFAIDELTGDPLGVTPAYSEPLTRAFLEANPFLVLDTQFFSATFKDKLLSGFDDLDAQTDGLLVKSENFGALNLLQARYKEQVKCIYIDPPYNTGGDGFAYKDNYQHSSWLSMIQDRLITSISVLADEGLVFISCDDGEEHRLRAMVESSTNKPAFMANLIWKSRQNVDSRAVNNISNDHEFVLAYGTRLRGAEKDLNKYSNPDGDVRGPWMSDNMVGLANRAARPNLHYHIFVFQQDTAVIEAKNTTVEIDHKILKLPAELMFKHTFDDGELVFLCVSIELDKIHSSGIVPSPLDGREVKPGLYTCPDKGWRFDPGSMARRISENRILWPSSGNGRPRKKTFERELKSDFTGFSSVVGYTADGTKNLKELFGPQIDLSFPKPVLLLKTLVDQASEAFDTILDYFAGSGTTGHAVINLNREDGGSRKYILVEMGDYFDTVLKPRIQKVVYSKDWKDGKPVSREGSSQLVKVLRLESYEDALNNLEVAKPATEQTELDFSGDAMKGFREDYLLHYMLDVETRGSASLLNIDGFRDPFAYELKIATSSAGETQPTKIDLVETFNYLLGLRVETTETVQGFKVVTGQTPAGEKVLVIWRNLDEQDDAALEAFFEKQGYASRDATPDLAFDVAFDLVYVNGDNTLQNLCGEHETWKVRLTEEAFQRLMFDVRDV